MIVNFNTFKEYEVPLLRLCNANDVPVCTINNPIDFNAEYNFNDFSTISFRVDYDTDRVCYENACVRKEIYLGKNEDELKTESNISVSNFSKPSEDCGYFIITEVEEVKNETERYKNITAKSCEYELSNVAMPYIGEDDGYDTFGSRVLFFAQDFLSPNGAPCVMYEVERAAPGWQVKVWPGNETDFNNQSTDKWSLPTRKIETTDTDTIYGFLVGTVAELYGCVFLFDIYHRFIYIRKQQSAIDDTDIVLSQDQLLENISLKQTEDDRINCILVEGSDSVDISNVNPLGGRYVYHFTDEYDKSVMSADLWDIVSDWMDDVESARNQYVAAMKVVHTMSTEISMLTTTKTSLEQKKTFAHSNYLATNSMVSVSGDQDARKVKEEYYYEKQEKAYEDQIDEIERIIASKETVKNQNQQAANGISNSLDFLNYIRSKRSGYGDTYVGELYSELVRLLRTFTYSNTSIVISDRDLSSANIPSFTDIANYDYNQDTTNTSIDDKVSAYKNRFDSWEAGLGAWEDTVVASVNKQFEAIQELYDEVYKVERQVSDGVQTGNIIKSGLLTRISKPRCDITIDSSDFVFVNGFAHLSEQIKTGCSIKVEKPDGTIQEHFVLKINVNYSAQEFSMTLSNRYRLNDPLSVFEDSYGGGSSIASLATSNAIILGKQVKRLDMLDISRKQSLNYTKQEVLSAENQEIIVDDSGMIVRTKNADNKSGYDDYQFKLANGSILFTDDNWNTASLAVGRWYDTRDHKWKMGINGDHIMAGTIDASTITVGLDYTMTANLIKDGSFDGRFLDGDSAWSLERSSTENPIDYTEKSAAVLYFPDESNISPIETTVRKIILSDGMLAKKKISGIPITQFDGGLYLNMFLHGSVDVTFIATYHYSNGRVSAQPYQRFNCAFENNDASHMMFFNIGKIAQPFDGTVDIEVQIRCNSIITYICGLCLSDRQYGYDTSAENEVQTENLCSDFAVLPHHAWDIFMVKSEANAQRQRLSTNGSGVIQFTDDNTYIIAELMPFCLDNGVGYTVDVDLRCDSGNVDEIALVNLYIVSTELYRLVKSSNPAERTNLIEQYNKIQSFSTYINFGDHENNTQFTFTYNGDTTDDAVLFGIISTNATTSSPIELISARVYPSDANAGQTVSRNINLWNYNNDAYMQGLYNGIDSTVTGFSISYDGYTYIHNSGGFDEGKYLSMPPGIFVSQKVPSVVFGGLLYYISAYINGYVVITVEWYDINGNTVGITNVVGDVEYNEKWQRVHCDSPVLAPDEARYAILSVYTPVVKQTNEDVTESGEPSESGTERIILSSRIDGILFEQSSSLNPYKRNEDEAFAQYVTLDSSGVSIYNGKIRIYNNNGDEVLSGDSQGNLSMTGTITATAGRIGAWQLTNSMLTSNDGRSTIDTSNGSFTSRSVKPGSGRDAFVTVVGSGSISFSKRDSSDRVYNRGEIYCDGSSFYINTNKMFYIQSGGYDVASFKEDGIELIRPVTTTVSFKKQTTFMDDVFCVSGGSIYVGGYDNEFKVVTRRDLKYLENDIDSLRGSLNSMIDKWNDFILTNSTQEQSNNDDSYSFIDQTQPTQPDVQPAKPTLQKNWSGLSSAMLTYINSQGYYREATPGGSSNRENCYNYARHTFVTKGGARVFSYPTNANDGDDDYKSWANQCGYGFSYA